MHIFATTCGLVGHVSSVLGMLEEGLRRGHTASWAAVGLAPVEGVEDRLRRSGVGVAELGAWVPMPGAAPELSGSRTVDVDDPFPLPFMREHFVAGHDDYVARIEAELQRCRAAVAVYDMTNVWTVIAAHRLGIPCVGIPQGWTVLVTDRTDGPDREAARALAGPRAELFRRFDVPPRAFVQHLCVSPDANLLATTAELLGAATAAALPPTYLLTGPALPRAGEAEVLPAGIPADRPFVYVSFGTVATAGLAVHRPVVEACAALGIACVVSSRDPDVARLAAIGDTRVFEHVPQVEVLKRCSAAVLHGGVNSLNEAVMCGVPAVIVPFFYDQFDGAICAVRAGVGRRLLRAELSPARVAEALAALLDPAAPERRRAAELKRSYEATDGNAASVDAMERLAGAR